MKKNKMTYIITTANNSAQVSSGAYTFAMTFYKSVFPRSDFDGNNSDSSSLNKGVIDA